MLACMYTSHRPLPNPFVAILILQGKLERCPTPYPKEMKHRIQHMRNLALKQLNVPNGGIRQGPDPGGGVAADAQRGKVNLYSSSNLHGLPLLLLQGHLLL